MPASPAFAAITCARSAAPLCPVWPPMLMMVPPPALHEMRQHRLGAQERAVEHDRQHAAPFVVAHVVERGLVAHRGVVHQEVDAAEALRGGLDQRAARRSAW